MHFVCAVSRHRSSDFGTGVESERRLGIQDDVRMYTKSVQPMSDDLCLHETAHVNAALNLEQP